VEEKVDPKFIKTDLLKTALLSAVALGVIFALRFLGY